MIGWLSVTYNDKPPMLKANRCSRSCQSVLLSPSGGGCEEAVYLPLRPHTCPASPSLVTHIYVVITVQCVLGTGAWQQVGFEEKIENAASLIYELVI